ncbi:MAG: AAA family ATPase [Candidatus Eisenbacteria bacterium]|nr:AAA family ATPase [Candidatus Eisenbacteria bacterium]
MSPRIIVVAGPNGSGKTTFAREFLQSYAYPYLSADEIAEAMDDRSIEDARMHAGRIFIEQLSERLNEKRSFLVESTLSGLSFKRTLCRARVQGYEVTIVFLFLRSIGACLARIRERVKKGGHPVPEQDVARRFRRSIMNFWQEYRDLADQWYLFYNGGVEFHEVALGEGEAVEVVDDGLFTAFLELTEESAS